jgi:hypothetical protein
MIMWWIIISTVLPGTGTFVFAESDGPSLLQLSKAERQKRDDDAEEEDEDVPGGTPWTGPAIVVHCAASSEAGSAYGCRKAFDSQDNTAWSTDGEGVGAWIEATLEGSWDLDAFTILQTGANELNKQVRLTFSDGSSQVKDLANTLDAQTIDLTPVTTSSVRIEVLDVYGTVNNGARTIAFSGSVSGVVGAATGGDTPDSALVELFGDVTSAAAHSEGLVDSEGFSMQGLHVFAGTSGYFGVYHSYIGEDYEVRLATSSDLTTSWTFVRTLVPNAKSPKIFVCDERNTNILLAYEQFMTARSRAPTRIAFELFKDEDDLSSGNKIPTYVAPLTAGFMSELEGEPVIYSASVTASGKKRKVLSASVGFRYYDSFRNMQQLATGEMELTVKNANVESSSFSGSRAVAYQGFFDQRGADGNSGSGTCGELSGQRYCLQEVAHLQPMLADVWETPAVYIYAFAGGEDATPLGIGTGGHLPVDASNVASQSDPVAGLGHPSWSVVPCPSSIDGTDCLFVSYYDRNAGTSAPQIAFVKPVP